MIQPSDDGTDRAPLYVNGLVGQEEGQLTQRAVRGRSFAPTMHTTYHLGNVALIYRSQGGDARCGRLDDGRGNL